jgi:catechol 2,3-dioxygenase-like lactoylglutathione lyase family enzyme
VATIDHVTVRTSDVAASLALFSRCFELLEFEGERFDNDGFHGGRDPNTFHVAGVEAGGVDNGSPGERPEYHAGYYGAYIRDPDSNNIEAVFHNR